MTDDPHYGRSTLALIGGGLTALIGSTLALAGVDALSQELGWSAPAETLGAVALAYFAAFGVAWVLLGSDGWTKDQRLERAQQVTAALILVGVLVIALD
jgi:hypothetical protein